ncbi:dipicolinate synthase subunit B [Oceanobacillus caeni]|uniref:Dipicolinate synthase subunit B n=1 Tax=Oceanobacillus caeni TaxID=405946 RepID=A0ABR5MGI1_9BACI|nr:MULTISPECIES: dipicolinate synthase subunit B [Bacillaceae]KKE78415.1 dipicolinate synthase subunit B [Bacilli bacterium VT-13-104]PZD88629.1 dipicolinate synthase subunit B [Bacilli bacterium]KPH71728.1 dipicolinate synthase subunit B [Oceanobacillus caeni]MBU8790044.1 dipicolinate synthase subunit B [Oceanobacillus caeni]MCR1833203.1 dipicolinate synthase subunit B [Oceanobacillus caeni]
MNLKGKRIGIGLTGSHHTFSKVFLQIENLVNKGVEVIPIASYTVQSTETKFGRGEDHLNKLEELTGQKVITSMPDAEPLGPDKPLDCMVIAPLTGNSMAKLANGITDNPVLMAAKSTIRNQNPVVLSVTTNDALGLNGINLARLLNSKFIYFVPFGQDNPMKKPNSLVANLDLLEDTIKSALDREQLQPIIIPF